MAYRVEYSFKENSMNLPNKITTFRMVLVVVLVALLLIPTSFNIETPMIETIPLEFFIGFFVFVIASFSDFLDGHIARKYNLVTTYGKFMDPIADKLLVNTTLIICSVIGPTRIPAIVVVIMVARDIVVDALRLIAMEKGKVVAASYFGKAKTVAQMIAISLVLLNSWPFTFNVLGLNFAQILCYVAGIISLLSGIDYLVKNRQIFKE